MPVVDEDTFFYRRVRALAAEGMQFTFITSSLDTPWGQPTNYELTGWSFTTGAMEPLLAFEGVNEPDIQGVESWIPATSAGARKS